MRTNNFRNKSKPIQAPVIYGIPFEGGTYWRKGAKDGPKYILEHLSNIRPVNVATGRELPWPLESLLSPSLELCPYNFADCFQQIEAESSAILEAGAVPIALGGDHSITIPILQSIARFYGPDNFAVIHIDAHSDTFPHVNGYRYHHGAVFRTLIEDGYLLPENIVQLGIRGAVRAGGNDFVKEFGIRCVSIDEWSAAGYALEPFLPVTADKFYLSFDIDVVDPAFAPGTGTPVPGGLSSQEAIRIIRSLQGLPLIGADFVEVAPIFDTSACTALLAAYLVFELLACADFHYPTTPAHSGQQVSK